jgi:5-methyltetrahydropteroyltriglutamate--homocysteine methyltransferase
VLATTIAGSLPKPAWLATPEALWAPWRLPPETLLEGQRDAVLLALREQEQAGIDVVTDGEQGRRHFVHAFVERLEGVDPSRRARIGIRGDRYVAEVPTVVGTVRRRVPIHADEAAFARASTTRRLKWTLPGPMTVVDTVADVHYGDRARLAMDVAAALNAEARELAALDRAVQGLRCDTAVHICYGYGIKANVDWKATLGREWRQYERTFPLLARSRIGQVSLECAASRVPLELLRLLDGKDVLAGVVDVADHRVETSEEVAATIRQVLEHVPAARLLPCTNCGMAPLPRAVARGKLRALGQGAALVRRELGVVGSRP